MPSPVRWVVGSRLGSFLLVVGVPILLVTGVLTIEWDATGPHFRFHRERAKAIRQEIQTEAVDTVRQYQQQLPGGDNSKLFGSRPGYDSQWRSQTTLASPPPAVPAPYAGQPPYPANRPFATGGSYQPAAGNQTGLAPSPTARSYDWRGTTR
jgi:hypothetical protein